MLPTDKDERKRLPIFNGPLMYFPDAIAEVARVCAIGNDQHTPGEPLHWDRSKSTEQMDTALRHMIDHGTGRTIDTDGAWHLAKAAWRILAALQLAIEKNNACDAAGDAMDPVELAYQAEVQAGTIKGPDFIPAFSIGDRVRIVGEECSFRGCDGTVLEVLDYQRVRVRVNQAVLWYWIKDLEKIEKHNEEPLAFGCVSEPDFEKVENECKHRFEDANGNRVYLCCQSCGARDPDYDAQLKVGDRVRIISTDDTGMITSVFDMSCVVLMSPQDGQGISYRQIASDKLERVAP